MILETKHIFPLFENMCIYHLVHRNIKFQQILQQKIKNVLTNYFFLLNMWYNFMRINLMISWDIVQPKRIKHKIISLFPQPTRLKIFLPQPDPSKHLFYPNPTKFTVEIGILKWNCVFTHATPPYIFYSFNVDVSSLATFFLIYILATPDILITYFQSRFVGSRPLSADGCQVQVSYGSVHHALCNISFL